jgi:hypothetical protein
VLRTTVNLDALLRRSPAADNIYARRVKKEKAVCIVLNAVRVRVAGIVSAEPVVRVSGNLKNRDVRIRNQTCL